MKKNLLHITRNTPCPPVTHLELYQQGKLLSADRFEIENHLSSCEICNDILEGLVQLNNENSLRAIETELKLRLEQMLEQKSNLKERTILYRRLAFAASILIIISISFIIYYAIYNKSNVQTFQAISKLDSSSSKILPTDTLEPEKAKIAQTKLAKSARSETKKVYEISVSDEAIEYESASSPSYEIMELNQGTAGVETIVINEKSATAEISTTSENFAVSKDSGKRLIKGIVKDESGSPLIGVNVVVKGTNRGVVSDLEGKFEISVEPYDKELNIKYIGYISESINLNNDSSLDIKMQPAVMALEEVEVDYGVQKKSITTAAVSKVMSSGSTASSPKKMAQLQQSVDSLKLALGYTSDKWATTRLLAEKYVELQYSSLALNSLNDLLLLSRNTKQKTDLQRIIALVKNGDFKKALRKLNKINDDYK